MVSFVQLWLIFPYNMNVLAVFTGFQVQFMFKFFHGLSFVLKFYRVLYFLGPPNKALSLQFSKILLLKGSKHFSGQCLQFWQCRSILLLCPSSGSGSSLPLLHCQSLSAIWRSWDNIIQIMKSKARRSDRQQFCEEYPV